MSLPSLCIRRPVFTVMLIALPLVLGLIALRGIGVDLFPNIDIPIVIITTSRPGASVEEMETGVTKVIEEAVNTISGIDELKSTTLEGRSTVTVRFVLEKSRDVAFQEVQSKVNTVLSQLPTGTDTPILDKFDIDAAPVIQVTVAGNRSLRELTELADRQIKDNLSSISGVGSVTRIGGEKRAINVTVDVKKLEAHGLSIENVRQALAQQNMELPGGRVDQGSRELILRTMGRIDDPARFADIIVADHNGQLIRIKDLGSADVVVDGIEEPRTTARLNGQNTVLLQVQKQSGTNTVEVIDRVKASLATLQKSFAETGRADIRLGVSRDQSRFINASLEEVEFHLVLGAFLVVLTILLFLRDWRTMLIAGVAIPVSVICTFPVMKALNLTLNNITLIALVLVIGIVIDDAVIVIENIFRWMEEKGATAREAALKGTQEITLAVVATTLSLVVIFLPIAFMTGTVGRFLSSFGITCAISILVSLGISMTLTPMLSSRFLRAPKHKASATSHHSSGLYGHLVERPYLLSLRWAMRHRWVIIVSTILVVGSIFPFRSLHWPGLIGLVGYDFIPKDDQSEFLIQVTTPPGWTLSRADAMFREIESRLREWPEATDILAVIGDTSGRASKGQGDVTTGSILVSLPEIKDRPTPFTQFQIMDRARKLLRDYPDLRVSVTIPAAVASGSVNADVEFQLVGPDVARLSDYADQIIANLRTRPGLVDIDTTLANRKPELRIRVDRDRAADLNVSIQTVASTLGTLVGGSIVTDYKDNQIGEQYDLWLRARGIDRDDPESVSAMTVPSRAGQLVRIASIAAPREDLGPAQIDRASRQRKISIIANLSGATTSDAATYFREAFASLNAPADYTLVETGRSKSQAESIGAFFMAFMLSLVLMYMILAAQFESFLHPITILLAVPLTIPFALLSLILLGQPLTIFSVLGLFLLFGIVKKNGILQVDYTNVLREQAAADPEHVHEEFRQSELELAGTGSWNRWMSRLAPEKRTRLWAILEANRVRLRPILMTTLMLVAAMIPIALGTGPGAASRADMAKVIVGGQTLSLLLSLLVTPVAYSLFDDIQLRFSRKPTPVPQPDLEEVQA